MGPTGCSETSVRNYDHLLRYNPEERNSHLLRGGSLKSRICLFKIRDWECLAQAVVPGRSILLQNSGLDPRPLHVGFVVDEVAVGQVFFGYLHSTSVMAQSV